MLYTQCIQFLKIMYTHRIHIFKSMYTEAYFSILGFPLTPPISNPVVKQSTLTPPLCTSPFTTNLQHNLHRNLLSKPIKNTLSELCLNIISRKTVLNDTIHVKILIQKAVLHATLNTDAILARKLVIKINAISE